MTLIAWMLGAIAIATLVTAAAAAIDWSGTVSRHLRGGRRWVWAAAMLASSVLPLILLARSEDDAGPGAILARATTINHVAGFAINPTVAAILLWAALSLIASIVLMRAHMGLMSDAPRWRSTALDNRAVLVAPDFGPAVIGFSQPRIVIPEWVLGLPQPDREMILMHEQEHVNARDQTLLLLCTFMAIVFPWNIAIWYQLHRAKCAIELDCDMRVVARVRDSVGYASVLLRASTMPLTSTGALSLAAPRTLAGTRIENLIATPKRSTALSLLRLLASCICLFLVLHVPLPRLGISRPLNSGVADAEASALAAAASVGPFNAPLPPAPSTVTPRTQSRPPAPTIVGAVNSESTGGDAVHLVRADSAFGSSAQLERAGLDSLTKRITISATGGRSAGGVQRSGMSDRTAELLRRLDSARAEVLRKSDERHARLGIEPRPGGFSIRAITRPDTLRR